MVDDWHDSRNPKMTKFVKTTLILALIGLIGLGVFFFVRRVFRPARFARIGMWIRNPEDHAEWAVAALESCEDSVFQMPTNGYVGFIWGDSFRPGHSHQGIDIFSGTEAGETPIYSAYDGYLTRLPDWKSSVIIRIPSDPLHPDRQIWTYYTHLADEEGISFIDPQFPTGTLERFIPAGTLIGHQGNYSGTPNHPVGVHLHFSIVKDDGNGKFLNELRKENTIDPSEYFNLPLNSSSNASTIPVCGQISD